MTSGEVMFLFREIVLCGGGGGGGWGVGGGQHLLLKTWLKCRVLARISKMPVQNSNFQNFACPDLATYLLQILIPATFNSLECVKMGNLHFSYVLEDGFL